MCSTRWGIFFSGSSSSSSSPPLLLSQKSASHKSTCLPRVPPPAADVTSALSPECSQTDCYCFFPSFDGESSVLLTQWYCTHDQQPSKTCESVSKCSTKVLVLNCKQYPLFRDAKLLYRCAQSQEAPERSKSTQVHWRLSHGREMEFE